MGHVLVQNDRVLRHCLRINIAYKFSVEKAGFYRLDNGVGTGGNAAVMHLRQGVAMFIELRNELAIVQHFKAASTKKSGDKGIDHCGTTRCAPQRAHYSAVGGAVVGGPQVK